MQYSRKKKFQCAYCKAIRKGSLSIAIHEKFEHNLENKYFSDLEKYGTPTYRFRNAIKKKWTADDFIKRNIQLDPKPKMRYAYQFPNSDLGVIPFFSHWLRCVRVSLDTSWEYDFVRSFAQTSTLNQTTTTVFYEPKNRWP